MKEEIQKRVIEEAHYMIQNHSTVRSTGAYFHVSKSTVFKDMRERLPKINHNLSCVVSTILAINKAERHIRGGLATKGKYSKK